MLPILPIQRAASAQSVHSWWSDRNPGGATIPLHTLAKPLSKLLHHRQVVGIIARSQSAPLSREILDVMSCYLEARDVEIPSSTKILILRELHRRATWELQARIIAQEEVPSILISMLHSTDPYILETVCRILSTLAVWRSGTCVVTTWETSFAISVTADEEATYSSQGVRIFIEENAWVLVVDMLQSEDSEILAWIYQRLGDIFPRGESEGRPQGISESNLCCHLVSLMNHPEPSVREAASHVVQCISHGSQVGTSLLTDPGFISLIPRLLSSPKSEILELLCMIIGTSSQNEILHATVLKWVTAGSLEPLLTHPSPSVQKAAKYALQYLTSSGLVVHWQVVEAFRSQDVAVRNQNLGWVRITHVATFLLFFDVC
ncbi:armadillo-type protein [Mycena vulgaris]|nr:armadillo-type protein [Mycena vulgaris]